MSWRTQKDSVFTGTEEKLKLVISGLFTVPIALRRASMVKESCPARCRNMADGSLAFSLGLKLERTFYGAVQSLHNAKKYMTYFHCIIDIWRCIWEYVLCSFSTVGSHGYKVVAKLFSCLVH